MGKLLVGPRSALALALLLTLAAVAVAAREPVAAAPCPTTDVAALEALLVELADKVEPAEGFWLVKYRATDLLVFAHAGLDRMRIATPVAKASDLDSADLRILLEANYDRALDARYSLYKGQVWSSFAHPLSSLARGDLESVLEQVVALRRNYGSTYASTSMRFGRGGH